MQEKTTVRKLGISGVSSRHILVNTVSHQSVLELSCVFVGIVRALAAVRNHSPRRKSNKEKVEQIHDGKPCWHGVSLVSLIYLWALDATISRGMPQRQVRQMPHTGRICARSKIRFSCADKCQNRMFLALNTGGKGVRTHSIANVMQCH